MRVSIMQPYFFPYLGYFSLIKHTDMFILLDSVQFIRHGWIERNRILKQDEGWLYIKVPIIKERGHETIIKDIIIDNKQNWKEKIISQMQPYKKIAPNYHMVIDLLNNIFLKEYDKLTYLNKEILETICNFLGIENNILVFSDMNLKIIDPMAPDEWALNICKALGNVDEYWNPSGGNSFFNREKYKEAGIKLKFQQIGLNPYPQKRKTFESGLSILDVLMFNSNDKINRMLNAYYLK